MTVNPFYRFFRRITFPLPVALFHKMPRHPAFKHEYWKGSLHWTPRPNTCDIFLDLAEWKMPPPNRWTKLSDPVTIRALQEEDWSQLPRLFTMAFCHWPPLSQWEYPGRASRCIIQWARDGKDGALIPSACLVATTKEDDTSNPGEKVVGAAIVVLFPTKRLRVPNEQKSEHIPHLDWIFVPWTHQHRGIGTLLLDRVIHELRALGHPTLASTVLTANPPAMLWHWRNGFRLPPCD